MGLGIRRVAWKPSTPAPIRRTPQIESAMARLTLFAAAWSRSEAFGYSAARIDESVFRVNSSDALTPGRTFIRSQVRESMSTS